MAWYAVYSAVTGAAVSFTSTEPDVLPAGLAYVTVTGQPDTGSAWDAAAHEVVAYDAVPANPTGALYEVPGEGWRWTYAIGGSRLAAKDGTAGRTAAPTDAAAQAYIKANSSTGDVDAAIADATATRDRILAALTAAGVAEPTQAPAYVAAQAALAFLGGCL